jgi:hypothetical protein
MTIEELKKELSLKGLSNVVNEKILSSKPVWLKEKESIIYQVKEKISKELNIHLKDIEIVGSAKIGISLSEERYGREFYKKSDVDIAIISENLFNEAWHQLLNLDFKYYKLTESQRQNLNSAYETIHRGFISPDRLPASSFKEKWWKVFNELSNKPLYEYRNIRGRLFKNWFFAEKYYSIQISKLNKAS